MFLDNVEKLIREATARYQQLDAQRTRLQEEKTVLEQNVIRTVEEELRVVGELRALAKVKSDAEGDTVPPIPPKEN